MSAPWPGSMRGSQVKSLLFLLLLLLLLNAGTVLCQNEEGGEDGAVPSTDEEMSTGDPAHGSTSSSEEATTPSSPSDSEGSVNPIIILIPVGLVMLIITTIVCGICISRRCNTKAKKGESKEEDPYLDCLATEKVPMPMFEEDVPSVLELEMEELDQWIQDGEATKKSMQK